MTSILKKLSIGLAAALVVANPIIGLAGNGDRVGQAGANELLNNPWARSSGWANSNIALAKGVEASFINVAGLALTPHTEVRFSYTDWFKGSGVKFNSVGLAQRLGQSGGVLGLTIVSMGFGEIPVTTYELPDGTNANYSPSLTNVGLSYAKEFSNSIYGGITVKAINQSFSSVSAQGFAFDAGIQYVTGKEENLHFGITLKNVGPAMRFSGDGLSTKVKAPGGYDYTINNKAEKFEIPSQLNIGVAYTHKLTEDHRLTGCLAFVSNSFIQDAYNLGGEYSFKNVFSVRGGYSFTGNDKLYDVRVNANSGLTFGSSISLPFGAEKDKVIGFDYSFRQTNFFSNTHSIGVHITL